LVVLLVPPCDGIVWGGGSCCSLSVVELLEACAFCHYFRSVLKKRRRAGAAKHCQQNLQ
jgi:hypothetical protein